MNENQNISQIVDRIMSEKRNDGCIIDDDLKEIMYKIAAANAEYPECYEDICTLADLIQNFKIEDSVFMYNPEYGKWICTFTKNDKTQILEYCKIDTGIPDHPKQPQLTLTKSDCGLK